MATYDKTWDNDAPAYNAATSRALNKIQDNAEIMWNCKTNSTWSAPTRALGTTYTNNSGYPMLVVMAVRATGGPMQGFLGLTAGDPAAANFQTRDPANGDGSLVTRIEVAATGAALLTAAESVTQFCSFILNDGGQYRANKTGAGNSIAAIDFTYEFIFDSQFSKTAFTHGEVVNTIASGKLKDYVDGVNGICKLDGAISRTGIAAAANAEQTVGSVSRFVQLAITSSNDVLLKDSGVVKLHSMGQRLPQLQ